MNKKVRVWLPAIVVYTFMAGFGHAFALFVWSHEREANYWDFYAQASIRDWFAYHILSLILIICSILIVNVTGIGRPKNN